MDQVTGYVGQPGLLEAIEAVTGILHEDGIYVAVDAPAAQAIIDGWDALTEAKAQARAAMAAHRYSREIAGTTVNGIQIQTDRASRAAVNDLIANVADGAKVTLKAATTFYGVTKSDLQALAAGTTAYVSSCFDAESVIDALIENQSDWTALMAMVADPKPAWLAANGP